MIPKDSSLIFECIAGSKLYGTADENSDTDIRGVLVPTIQDLLNPFNNFEQHIETKERDLVYYSIKKFFLLLTDANPNILELLFAPNLVKHWQWSAIVYNSELFITKRIFNKFVGYANAEWRRYYSVHEDERSNKHAMHVIRLFHECEELVTTGKIEFPLKTAGFLNKIRQGYFGNPTQYLVECEQRIQQLEKESKLPDKPDFDKIKQLYLSILGMEEPYVYRN